MRQDKDRLVDVVKSGGRPRTNSSTSNPVKVTGIVHFADCNAAIRPNTFDNSNVAISTTVLHNCTNSWFVVDWIAGSTGISSPSCGITPETTNWAAQLHTTFIGIPCTVTE